MASNKLKGSLKRGLLLKQKQSDTRNKEKPHDFISYFGYYNDRAAVTVF